MPKYCPECGRELLDDNPNFCPECGKQIEGKKESVDEVFKKRHARKGIKKAVMIVIFIFAAVAFIYVFYTYLDINGFLSPMGGLSGTWEGSGTFTNNCDNPACAYNGGINPPSVILVLQQNGNNVFGTVTLNIPASQVQTLIPGQGCSGRIGTSDIYNGVLSGNRLTFADSGYNIWTINFLSNNCQGTVDNNDMSCTGLRGSISLSKK